MTVSATHLTTSGSSTDASSYNTDSITPGADRLVLAWVTSSVASGTANEPALSGNSLTWVTVGTVQSGSGLSRLTLARAMDSAPTAGAVTIDFDGQTQILTLWSIADFSGTQTSGSNGEDAIDQSADGTASGTTLEVTLGAFAAEENATAGGMFLGDFVAVSPGDGFTELGETGVVTEQRRLQSQWRADNDTTVDWSWSPAAPAFGIAVEIRAESTEGTWGAIPVGF